MSGRHRYARPRHPRSHRMIHRNTRGDMAPGPVDTVICRPPPAYGRLRNRLFLLHQLAPDGQVLGGRRVTVALAEPLPSPCISPGSPPASTLISARPTAGPASRPCARSSTVRTAQAARRPGISNARSAAPSPRRSPRNPRMSARLMAGRRNSRTRPLPRDLAEIPQRYMARADIRGSVAAVAMGRQEPQDVRGGRYGHGRLLRGFALEKPVDNL